MSEALDILNNRYYEPLIFKIDSACHIMDVIINPSFARAVCFQIHKMRDNSCKVFWEYELRGREKFALIGRYINENRESLDLKMPVVECVELICRDPKFLAMLKADSQIHSADLSENDMALVNAVIDANWEPVEYGGGLDGHSYKIKIYGENPREYNRWCDIPASWKDLIPLVDFLIDVANLTPRHCYEVSFIDGKYLHRAAGNNN